MLSRCIALGLAGLLVTAPPASALYDDAALEESFRRAADGVREMLGQRIVPAVPATHRDALSGIQLQFEARGAFPLDFRAGGGTIYFPISSLRFVDDLTRLTAWFEHRGCDAVHIQSYLAALLGRGQPLPPPLDAFGLDRDAVLREPFVDELSLKLLNSILFFVLAHEVGHLALGHTGSTGAHSQAQEVAADAFALETMANDGMNPMGMVVFFTALRWTDPTGHGVAGHTHPISPTRIRALADGVAAQPHRFVHPDDHDPAGAALGNVMMAQELHTIALIMDDEELLTGLRRNIEIQYPPSRFAAACPP